MSFQAEIRFQVGSSIAAGGEYHSRVKTLAAEWPENWGLVYSADVKARGPHLVRCKRLLETNAAASQAKYASLATLHRAFFASSYFTIN